MWWTFLIGMLGGVANSLLVEEGFVLPQLRNEEKKGKIFRPGFIGNMVLGGIAALATYLLGASRLEFLSQLGIALVSGVGGGNVLTSLMQKQETGVLKAQMEGLERTIRQLGKGPDKE
jgi:hypothetical protein